MAFSNILAEAGHTADSVSTTAKVQLRPLDGKPSLASIELEVEGRSRESTRPPSRSTPRPRRPAARSPARWPACPRSR
jgi:hypothetical protein